MRPSITNTEVSYATLWPPKLEGHKKLEANRDVKRLVKALKSGKWDIRRSAAMALGRLEDVQAVEPLCRALSDENPNVGSEVAKALVAIGGPRALEAILGNEGSLLVVEASGLVKLAKTGGAQAAETLRRALNSPSKITRRTAAEALGMLGDKQSVKPLIQLLSRKDSYFSVAAARALARLRDPEAVPALVQALKGEDESLRYWAARALESIGGTTASNALAEYKAEKELTCEICKKVQPDKSHLIAVATYGDAAPLSSRPSPDYPHGRLYCLDCAQTLEEDTRRDRHEYLEKHKGVQGYKAIWHVVDTWDH